MSQRIPRNVHVDPDRLRHLIEIEKLQQRNVAEILGVSTKVVSTRCRKLGLKTQRRGPRSGDGHPDWKGGIVYDKHGYVLVYRPGHHRARKCGSRKPRYVLQHILVMEEKLGRPLGRKEVVHHIDGNPSNNHPDNLMLFGSNADHLRHELTGRCPQWTPEGRARILEATRKPRASYQRKAPCVPMSRGTTGRFQARPRTGDQSPSGTA